MAGTADAKGKGKKKESILQSGEKAPNFELPASAEKKYALKDYRGKPVVLIFYPADFSPVCTDQLALYSTILPQFEKYGAQLFGISVDSIWSHAAFAADRGVKFPLLSDFNPKGKVSKKYGAFSKREDISERALFVLDPKGRIYWSYLSPMGVNPGADGILKALRAMKEEGI
ncbi:redoxin domain-containing protein [Methanomassiliicoccus luminyensis]|uniref:redoxin domain-containing protein n=1 Tax=Methanomassiliicoccus luminyensis TaxID=1080712 RepID=UPI0003769007|nr:redoxin domain-containing protein [Methanomassiliicoccus luminyensis]